MAKTLDFTKDGGKVYLCTTGSVVGYDADLTDLLALVEEVQTGEGEP